MKSINKLASTVNEKTKSNSRRFLQIELLALVSSAIMLFLNRAYLISMPEDASFGDWSLLYYGMIANTVLLNFTIGLILFLPIYFIKKSWPITKAAPIFFFLFNAFIYIDSIVYGLYRFHFNSMVWNMMTTEGINDSVTLGFQTIVYTVSIFILILLGLYGLFYLALAKVNWQEAKRKTIVITNIIVILLILASKFLYAYGDIAGLVSITRVHNIVPFYVPLTMKRMMKKRFGVKPKTTNNINITNGGTLNYPKNDLKYKENHNKPNVLMIFIEGARFDMLEPEVMPNLDAWSQDHIRAENHYSGGNSSRFGLFSGLYGIHATYWHSFLSEQKRTVLIDELKKMDYRFGIFSSTDLHFPELRQTAFIGLDEYIKDRFQGGKTERDIKITDEAVKIINEQSEQPYFSFMFYDASHQPYRYPESHEVFKTDLNPDDINYATLATSKKSKWNSMRNRYKNSLHYIDEQLGRIFIELDKNGNLNNTIVLIAGDHGEAFGELNGHLGHNNSFSRFQTKTIMVAHLPGVESKIIHHTTSHYDWLPTIFEYMGIQNENSDYSQGQSLLNPNERDYLIISCWDTAALLFKDGIVEFGHYNAKSGMKAHTLDWNLMENPDSYFNDHIHHISNYIQNAGSFKN